MNILLLLNLGLSAIAAETCQQSLVKLLDHLESSGKRVTTDSVVTIPASCQYKKLSSLDTFTKNRVLDQLQMTRRSVSPDAKLSDVYGMLIQPTHTDISKQQEATEPCATWFHKFLYEGGTARFKISELSGCSLRKECKRITYDYEFDGKASDEAAAPTCDKYLSELPEKIRAEITAFYNDESDPKRFLPSTTLKEVIKDMRRRSKVQMDKKCSQMERNLISTKQCKSYGGF